MGKLLKRIRSWASPYCKKKLFLLFIPLGFGLYFLISPMSQKKNKPLVQGYIEGKFVYVAPAVAGQVEKILVNEGDSVKKGQKLFVLECQREIAARDTAAAQLEHAKEVLENLQKGKRPEEIEAIKASIEQAKAALHRSDLFLKRQKILIKTHAISQQSYDDATTAYESAKARVEELEANLKVANLPAREDEIHAAKANIQANEANLRQQQWVLDQKTVLSPVTGVVQEKVSQEGDWATSGASVLTLLPLDTMKIRFFVPQSIISKLTVQTKIKIYLDEVSKPIDGTITFISTEAQYNPPMIYSREMRSKFVYLVEANPETQNRLHLHPGQPVDVELNL